MRKYFIISIGLVLALVVIKNSFSQSFFFNSPQTNTQNTSGSTKALSPDEFKNRVSSMAQQNQKALTERAKKLLTNPPPPPLPQAPKAPPETNQPTQQTNKNTMLPAPTPSEETPPIEAAAPHLPAAPPPPAPTVEQNLPAAAAPPPQPSSQPYTGFSNGQSGGTNNSGSQQSGGGWDIRY